MRAIARREYRHAHRRARAALRRAHREDRGRQGQAPRDDDRAAREVPRRTTRDHEQFTPDAMFRLADLYLDEADEEVDRRLAAHERAPPDPNAPDAAAIVADYSQVARALGEHPQGVPELPPDAVDALPARVLRQDEGRAALAAAVPRARVREPLQVERRAAAGADQAGSDQARRGARRCARSTATAQPYPGADAELVRHAWVRGIADYHFTVPGEIDEAIAAYLKVADGGNDSQALRRVALQARVELLQARLPRGLDQATSTRASKLYDATVAAGGTPPLELRDESIQYIAVAFTDPWHGETDTDPVKAFERAKEFYKGRENEPHVRDVWVAMGQAFEDLQAWDQAVDAYRIAIGPPWELEPEEPGRPPEDRQRVREQGRQVRGRPGRRRARDALRAGHGVVRGEREGPRGDGEPAPDRGARALCGRAQHALGRDAAAQGLRRRGEEGSAAEAGIPRDVRQGGRPVPPVHRDVSRERLRLRVQLPPGRGAVLQRALSRGDRRSTSGSAITATSARRTTSTPRARSSQSYEAEAPSRKSPRASSQPLKVPTVAELKAMPQPWQPQPIPQIYRRAAGRVRQLPEHRPRPGGRAEPGHQRRADQPRVPPHRRRDRALHEGDGQVLRGAAGEEGRARAGREGQGRHPRDLRGAGELRRDRGDEQARSSARSAATTTRSSSRSTRTAR